MQVIEWYDTAYLGSDGLIDKAKAILTPAFIAKTNADFDAAKGVFLNPVTTSLSIATLPDS